VLLGVRTELSAGAEGTEEVASESAAAAASFAAVSGPEAESCVRISAATSSLRVRSLEGKTVPESGVVERKPSDGVGKAGPEVASPGELFGTTGFSASMAGIPVAGVSRRDGGGGALCRPIAGGTGLMRGKSDVL